MTKNEAGKARLAKPETEKQRLTQLVNLKSREAFLEEYQVTGESSERIGKVPQKHREVKVSVLQAKTMLAKGIRDTKRRDVSHVYIQEYVKQARWEKQPSVDEVGRLLL